jgi:hypothetical protein
MNCAIMQPTYIPWLGYFDLIDQVDKFVFLDDVKLEKSSWHVRNRIKTNQGDLYLTIPIKRLKSRPELVINEVLINDSVPWRKKHLRSIQQAYQKSPFFETLYPAIEQLLNNDIENLSEFNINIISSLARAIGIKTAFVRSSQMEINPDEYKKDHRLVGMCEELGCDTYISPQGSSDYIEKNNPGGAFLHSKISLFYMNYHHPVYDQQHGEFFPFMSIVDLLMNKGSISALEIIRSGRGAHLTSAELKKLQNGD